MIEIKVYRHGNKTKNKCILNISLSNQEIFEKVRESSEFKFVDAKSGEDVTHRELISLLHGVDFNRIDGLKVNLNNVIRNGGLLCYIKKTRRRETMNLNELAKKVTLEETGKKQVSIAQVKEIIKIISIELAQTPGLDHKLRRLGNKHLGIKAKKEKID